MPAEEAADAVAVARDELVTGVGELFNDREVVQPANRADHGDLTDEAGDGGGASEEAAGAFFLHEHLAVGRFACEAEPVLEHARHRRREELDSRGAAAETLREARLAGAEAARAVIEHGERWRRRHQRLLRRRRLGWHGRLAPRCAGLDGHGSGHGLVEF